MTAVPFVNVGSLGLPDLNLPASADTAWGDYDNDGRLDLLVVGGIGPQGTVEPCEVRLFHHRADGQFEQIHAGLTEIAAEGSAAWGDYDNDGLLDILLTGRSANGPTAKIYHNDGGGAFHDIAAGLRGVGISSAAWGDYDNDGKLDLVLCGSIGTAAQPNLGEITLIYHNDGNGQFHDVAAGLPGVMNSSLDWGDYDHDGKLDLLLTGYSSAQSATFSRIYHNDGNGQFHDIAAELTGVALGSARWGDYDNDGTLDILLNGSSYPNRAVSTIYHNDGHDHFREIVAGLVPAYAGSASWGDYDGDGLLDVLLNGSIGTEVEAIQVYHNDGHDRFHDISTNLPATWGPADWIDYDSDGHLDIFVMGSVVHFNMAESGQGFFHNVPVTGADLAVTVSVPAPNTVNGAELIYTISVLNNGPGTAQNVRLSDPLPANTVFVSNSGSSGWQTTNPSVGQTGTVSATIASLPPGVSTFQVVVRVGNNNSDNSRFSNTATVATGPTDPDPANNQGAATVVTFRAPAPFAQAGSLDLGGLRYPSVAVGDYDNDGRADLLVIAHDTAWKAYTRVYHNDGGGSFHDIGLPLAPGDRAEWGDYDNDGRLDISVSGSSNGMHLYHNGGNGRFSELPAPVNGSILLTDLPAWGDYDGDGRLDFIVTTVGDGGFTTRLYHNDGNNQFHDIQAFAQPFFGTKSLVDYDGDGRADIAVICAGYPFQLYHNDGNGKFHDVGAVLTGGMDWIETAAWADYDKDGRLDLALCGSNPGQGCVNRIYHNDGNGRFHDISAGLAGAISTLAWGDYDGDGQLDIAIAGYTSGAVQPITKIYHNDGNGQFHDIYPVLSGIDIPQSVFWCDIDGDRRLDVLIMGMHTSQSGVIAVYRNTTRTPQANKVIFAPSSLEPTKSDLVITGTTGNDRIEITRSKGGKVSVRMNGKNFGPFLVTGRIVAHGLAGNDKITVDDSIRLSAFLFGDDGNDDLRGGSGDDVIVGGSGCNTLRSGDGRDVLIGGSGPSQLYANGSGVNYRRTGGALLIAGATIYDDNESALWSISKVWSSTATYANRVNALRSGSNPYGVTLDNSAIIPLAAADQLFGSSATNWFWNVGNNDRLKGRKRSEFVN